MSSARAWIFASLTACAAATADAPDPRSAPAAAPAASPASTTTSARAPRSDDDLTGVIDRAAPPWQVTQWFNSPPLALDQLRGKVVFVRWFMGPSCPFCSA